MATAPTPPPSDAAGKITKREKVIIAIILILGYSSYLCYKAYSLTTPLGSASHIAEQTTYTQQSKDKVEIERQKTYQAQERTKQAAIELQMQQLKK